MARNRNIIGQAATYLLLSVFVFCLGLPFVWMLLTSFKPSAELLTYPPSWWPEVWRWRNYVEAWQAADFGWYFFNSAVTSTAATGLQVLFAAMMAYAFARIPFPGKPVLLGLVLATMLIPDEMKLIPNYLLMARLGWIDTYWALIVPPAAHAFPVFILYQHFRMLPKDMLEAAEIDGAGHVRLLFRILVPMSRPVLAACLLMSFIGRWNDFLWPLVVTETPGMRTLPIGLAFLKDVEAGAAQWHLLMAASVFVIIPVLILFVAVQKQFIGGITQGALKG